MGWRALRGLAWDAGVAGAVAVGRGDRAVCARCAGYRRLRYMPRAVEGGRTWGLSRLRRVVGPATTAGTCGGWGMRRRLACVGLARGAPLRRFPRGLRAGSFCRQATAISTGL